MATAHLPKKRSSRESLFGEDGVARAGMGVDAADYDHSGFPSLLITNFSNQMLSLYHNEGKGLFVDEAPRSKLAALLCSLSALDAFSLTMILMAGPTFWWQNGHIDADIQRLQANVKYAMPPHLFRNIGKGKFEEVTKSLGKRSPLPGGAWRRLCRYQQRWPAGLAALHNGGPVYLFLNEAQGAAASNKSLRIKLIGTKSNRDGIGTTVKLTARGETQTQMLRSGSSYLSASELVLAFGLAHNEKADTVEIRWPGGQIDRLSNATAGQTITVTEGKGITAFRAYGKKN